MFFELTWGRETPEFWLYAVWTVWGVAWIAMGFWTAKAKSAAPVGSQLTYILVTVVGFYLLFSSFEGRPLGLKGLWAWLIDNGVPVTLWVADDRVGWAMVGFAIVGFLFALWARLHLGKLWSGGVQAKPDHRVVDDGPYGIVRHPIYTGLLAGALALAVVKGNLFAILGFVVTVIGFWIKARLEERWLAQELGAEAYAGYRKRVPMLLPFGPK